jgi:hypothetical protein
VKPIPSVKPNEIFCTGCNTPKSGSFFSRAQRRLTTGQRRCYVCQQKRDREWGTCQLANVEPRGGVNRDVRKVENKAEHNNCRMRGPESDSEVLSPTVSP